MTNTETAAASLTEAIVGLFTRVANGEHGVLEVPCHLNPEAGVTAAAAVAKVEEVLARRNIEAAVEFDGATLTIIV
jgi:hypothetical protein